MLNVEHIFKSFSSSQPPLLKGVNFNLNAGESIAIMGASGCGKSSLLNIIAGLLACDSGHIQFNDTVLTQLNAKARDRFRAEHIGMVFQQFNLIDCLTVKDNITLPARYLGLKGTPSLSMLLSELGIEQHQNLSINQLSGGEQQRVAIARAFVHQPQLILADEPTGNLDNATSAHVASLLFDLVKQTGTSMVVVTHSDEVAQLADRTLYLRDGILEL